MSKIKGQNVTINSTLVADETNCTVTVTGNTEDVTTKGEASLFSRDTMTSKSWQVQVDTYQAEASVASYPYGVHRSRTRSGRMECRRSLRCQRQRPGTTERLHNEL